MTNPDDTPEQHSMNNVPGTPIKMPLATFTMIYGLDDQGEPCTSTMWESHDSDHIPHIIRHGMLAAAQEEITLDMLDGMHDDDE